MRHPQAIPDSLLFDIQARIDLARKGGVPDYEIAGVLDYAKAEVLDDIHSRLLSQGFTSQQQKTAELEQIKRQQRHDTGLRTKWCD